MSQLDELIDKLDRLEAGLPEALVQVTEGAALNALQQTDARITETGASATGSPFKDYTPAYKKRKEAKGRYRGFVDFQDTTEMLRSTTTGFENIAVTERQIREGNVKISFDGRDQLTKDKLRGNNKVRPGFLDPSPDEIERVTSAANTDLAQLIDDLLR